MSSEGGSFLQVVLWTKIKAGNGDLLLTSSGTSGISLNCPWGPASPAPHP